LQGFIDLPAAAGKHPLILIVHGSGSTDVTHGDGGYNSSYDEMRAAFHRAGIATAIWDKAGNGCSEGRYVVGTPLIERTDETVAAIDHLKLRSDVDQARIGLWAISQGGWIAPMAAVRRPEVAFLIIVSGPGRDAESENEYYALNRLAELGVGKFESEQALAVLRRSYAIASAGGSHEEFLAAIEPLERYPLFGREMQITETPQMKVSPASAAAYRTNQQAPDYALRTETYLLQLRQPTLAIFGDRDVQVDWRTSVRIYNESFKKAHNRDLTIKIYPGAGHDLYHAPIPDKDSGSSSSSAFIDGYLDLMVEWLRARGFARQPSG
jgi:pimeloyl-ACP methyl ester carboxylesterase